MHNKDQENISRTTKTFVSRLITGIIVFFVLSIVKLVIGVIETNNTEDVAACLNEIFGNK